MLILKVVLERYKTRPVKVDSKSLKKHEKKIITENTYTRK
jgi:hypothetical protein